MMWQKIFSTVGARYLVAVANLVVVILNAKALGLQQVGEIGLLTAAVNLIITFNSLFTGSTLVYFLSRAHNRPVLLLAYGWAIVGSFIGAGIFALLPFFSLTYMPYFLLLSLLGSVANVNTRRLLAWNNISGFNWTYLLQGGLILPFVCLLYYGVGYRTIDAFLGALFLSYLIAMLTSLGILWSYGIHTFGKWVEPDVWKNMLRYGLWAAVDNAAEVLTTRINHFLIRQFTGWGGVGLLDSGTKVSESVWNISRALGFLANSSVARTANEAEQKQKTLHLLRVTFAGTFLLVAVIVCIPEWFYTEILFSEEFVGITGVIRGLAIGMVAFGCHTILSQYLIASGHVKYSALSSIVGLAVLLAAGVVLIRTWGIVGAAASTSVAYVAMCLTSLTSFARLSGTRWHEFLPTLRKSA